MNPLVSISCITFNHKQYIRQALDGFLMQKTGFAFEVLVHDDASTDGTTSIIREYAQKYPDIVFPLVQKENQWSRGIHAMSLIFNVPRARGQYIALCEGDDYWTDPLKLQKQVDFLEKNPDVAGCFHNAVVVDGNSTITQPEWFDGRKRAACGNQVRFNQEDCLKTLSHQYPTCSLVFRADAARKVPAWVIGIPSGDYALDLLLSGHGDLVYLPENMAAYRIHAGGIWQGSNYVKKQELKFIRYKILYSVAEFRHRYGVFLKRRIQEHAQEIFTKTRKTDLLKRLKYFYFFKRYGW